MNPDLFLIKVWKSIIISKSMITPKEKYGFVSFLIIFKNVCFCTGFLRFLSPSSKSIIYSGFRHFSDQGSDTSKSMLLLCFWWFLSPSPKRYHFIVVSILFEWICHYHLRIILNKSMKKYYNVIKVWKRYCNESTAVIYTGMPYNLMLPHSEILADSV